MPPRPPQGFREAISAAGFPKRQLPTWKTSPPLPGGYGSWGQVGRNVRQEHAGPGGPFGLTPPPSPSPPRPFIDIQEDHGRESGPFTSATILAPDRRAPNGSPF